MEKYFEILEKIKNEKIDITKLYLLSCIDESYGNNNRIKIMDYCYDVWLEADVDIALSRLADVVQEHWEEIQQDMITDEEIIEICLDVI